MTRIDDLLEQLRTGTMGNTEAMLSIQQRLNKSEEVDAEALYRQVDEAQQNGLASGRAQRVRELIETWFAGESTSGDATDDALSGGQGDDVSLELEPPEEPEEKPQPESGGGDSPESDDASPGGLPPLPEVNESARPGGESREAEESEQSDKSADSEADSGERKHPTLEDPAGILSGLGSQEPDKPEPPESTPPSEPDEPAAGKSGLPPVGGAGGAGGAGGTGDAGADDDDSFILQKGGAGELTRGESERPRRSGASQSTTMVGALLGGRFELLSRISQDAYGSVFRARDHAPAKDAASPICGVRVLPRSIGVDKSIRSRLEAVISRTGKIQHRGILHPRELQDDGERMWLVTDAPNGTTLARFIRRKCIDGLEPEVALPIIRRIGEALLAAHSKGITHGDLRPSSIYITSEREVQITDFGLRVALYGSNIPSGQAGTTEIEQMDPIDAYLTLDILEGSPPEPRDDIYALACIAAAMMTGGHPFHGQSALRRLERDLKPPRVRKLKRVQNQALRAGLAMHREDRPEDVHAFLEWLETEKTPLPRVPIAVASLILIAVAAGWYPAQQWLEQQREQELIQAVSDTGWPAIRGELRGLDAEEQALILEALEDDILAMYADAIDQAVHEDPQGARSLHEEALELYPDSQRLAEAEGVIEEAIRAQAAEAQQELSALIEARELTPRSEGNDVPGLIAHLERLGVEEDVVNLEALRDLYLEAGEEAAQTANREHTEGLLSAARDIFPGDERLHESLIEAGRTAEARASREQVAEITGRLGPRMPPGSFQALANVREDLIALLRAGGQHDLLSEQGSRIADLVGSEVDRLGEAGEWAEANQVLREFAPLLPTDTLRSMRRDLSRAQSEADYRPASIRAERQGMEERRERVGALLEDARHTPPWAGELIVVWREAMAWLRPGRTWPDEYQERMETMFVERAEYLLDEGREDDARAAAAQGLELAPNSRRLSELAAG